MLGKEGEPGMLNVPCRPATTMIKTKEYEPRAAETKENDPSKARLSAAHGGNRFGARTKVKTRRLINRAARQS